MPEPGISSGCFSIAIEKNRNDWTYCLNTYNEVIQDDGFSSYAAAKRAALDAAEAMFTKGLEDVKGLRGHD